MTVAYVLLAVWVTWVVFALGFISGIDLERGRAKR